MRALALALADLALRLLALAHVVAGRAAARTRGVWHEPPPATH